MSVEFNSPYTVFIDEAERRVTVLDQRLLPHRVEHVDLKNAQEAAEAIRDMTVRGAPLIGVTAQPEWLWLQMKAPRQDF